MGKMIFPTSGNFDSVEDLGQWRMNFVATRYSNKQSVRAYSGVQKFIGTWADITLPMPESIKIDNRITYTRDQADVSGSVFDMTLMGLWSMLWEGSGISEKMNSSGISAALGHRPMDETDSIFQGAEFRRHSYSWKLVPKAPGDAAVITKIVREFQRMAYPNRTVADTYSRILHPPIWFISAMDTGHKGSEDEEDKEPRDSFRWDMGPLPSVLENVSIQTQGAAGGPYASRFGYPAATSLSLNFVELEPAVNTKSGLMSRSQVRGVADAFTDTGGG
jgi:hypothetical protein